MNRNFKLTIEYDGTDYHGWQRQRAERTVQQEIETVIGIMTGGPVTLIGAGRTDAGVHAHGQVANFACDTKLTPGIFLKGLNSLLPEDIAIRCCQEVSLDFHARFRAKSKTYRYRILNRPVRAPIGRQYAWQILKPLDLPAMQRAAGAICGTHDFKAFESTGSPRSSTVRTVFGARLYDAPGGYVCFEIQADGFLKYMVRNIVGTLVRVGQGKLDPQAVEQILASKDRHLAGITAPSRGLCLVRVDYE